MNSLEKALMDSIKKGNHKSFELVFKTYYPKLCVYAFEYTRQMETAEDLVKDFFVDFWESREKISVNSSLSGYLFRSVHNACINYLKRNKEKNKTSLIDDFSSIEIKLKNPYSDEYPLGNIYAKELEEQLKIQIGKLPEQCREIFLLSRIEGLPHKKIAEKLNISENTVKVQIFRALCKLKETLLPVFVFLFSFFR
jgi:RNA polymerase sigma-70 factor (ECF subfamily)